MGSNDSRPGATELAPARPRAPASVAWAQPPGAEFGAGLELAAVFDALHACALLVGADDRVLACRCSRAHALAVPPDSAPGRPIVEVLPPIPGGSLVEALARSRKTGAAATVDYAVVGGRGLERFEARLAPMDGGRLAVVVLEATSRLDAIEALRRSEERLRAIIETEPECVKVLGRGGELLEMNPSGLAMLEAASLEEARAKPLDAYVVPRCRPAFQELAQRVLQGGTGRLEFEMVGLRGTHRWLQTSAVPLRGAHGEITAILGVTRDVTEQRRLQEELAQAQKLESIGQLAGGVAHDFNNLLVSILGNAEFLEGELGPGHPALEEVRDIRHAGQRARELTGQLLAVARRQIIAPRVVNLNDVVRDAEKLLRRVIGEDVTVEVRLAEAPWSTRADVGQLQQVLLNLAVNARDAMPRGGRLTLETQNVQVTAARAPGQASIVAGPYVLLRVSDTGEGMSDEVQRHVFEPFFTTKAPGKGTGLGLAMVYGVVTQSGGHITFRSRPGAGTTFEILLPRSSVDSESPAAAEPSRAPRHGTETVLVVEDDAGARDVTVRGLREAGYRVLVAVDARHALEVYAKADGPVDLLLTDLVMPGGTGKDVADALRRRQPALRVLYVSGYTQDGIVHRGVLHADVAFLAKPFTPSSLLAKVGEVLDAPR